MNLSPDLENSSIAVVGLGYVGLPLAVALSKYFMVTGFDTSTERIGQLKQGVDVTGELSGPEVSALTRMLLSHCVADMAACKIFIIAVPTPVDSNKLPDLTPLLEASGAVGSILKPGDLVIYESTVYPGATEEICVPELERASGLKFNRDFFCGYSPERISPGDRTRRLADIVKITSGSTLEAAQRVDALYRCIVKAGTHLAPSIRVAEAAKAVENTQRDINIAFANELAMMFHRMDIDTEAVLQAAETKWNFMPVRPGLVGGHCIGVDPYYLIHKAEEVGAVPELIRAARRINEGMSEYVIMRLVRAMAEKGIAIPGARILILGLTFKENCPDLRNTRVIEIIRELHRMHAEVDVHDPWADPEQAQEELGIRLHAEPKGLSYNAILIAVAHHQYRQLGVQGISRWLHPDGVIFDGKYILHPEKTVSRL